MKTWYVPCAGTALELGRRTLVMGIVNVTPDSFSDGGRHLDPGRAVESAWQMVTDGADLIDVGGESTRPGHTAVPAGEELERVLPVIRRLTAERIPVPISIDSYKAAVAAAALDAGAVIINDVWGFQRDPDMAKLAARHQVPAILMHNRNDTRYADVMGEVKAFLRRSLNLAEAAGLPTAYTILDPGIGFGKTWQQSLTVLGRLGELTTLGRPFLLGVSRKAVIGHVLEASVDERLEGTAAAVALGIAAGAAIVRVHDVRFMTRVARMADAIVGRTHTESSPSGGASPPDSAPGNVSPKRG